MSESSSQSTPDLDELLAWQYELPPELIASRPAERRDGARMMVLDRKAGTIRHSTIAELPEFLAPGDLMIFNNTKVLPARMFGKRTATGGKWEGLFVEERADGNWRILCETRGRLLPDELISVLPAYALPATDPQRSSLPESSSSTRSLDAEPPQLTLRLCSREPDGSWIVEPAPGGRVAELLEQFGSLPLPPYMGRRLADDNDRDRYQTSYASEPGAIAAPTAGLHFTPELLARCEQRGAAQAQVTLHVGIGTFRPVTVERLSDHTMHDEWCRVPADTCRAIQTVKSSTGRLVAVGTTSVRTLESAAIHWNGELPSPWSGRTQLFIRPGFRFQMTDCLLTNFHLPGSTLIVMVAALAGYDFIMEAYRQAVRERYRFFSYGDAMLIV